MGFAKAAAAIMQAAAPNVGTAYTNAANATAGYARGLGNSVQAPLDQSYQSNADFLSKMGTPSAGIQQAPPVGNIAYGLQGYIPASSMQREGAAWESAAQLAPGNVLNQGQQSAAATLASDPQLSSLQNELAKVAATYPDVFQKLLSTVNEQAYRQATLGQAQQRIASENAYRKAELGLSGQRLQLETERAAQTAINSNRSYRLALARVGISQKNLQLRAAALEGKNKSGGFTPNELVTLRGHAGAIAIDAFNGVPSKQLPALNYKQAMQHEILAGIPPTIAADALRKAGYKIPASAVAGIVSGAQAANKLFSQQGGASGRPFAGVKSDAGKTIVALARGYLGIPYLWGGTTPKGFDCSGFAEFLYNKAGIQIPRTTYTQWQAPNGMAVPRKELQPGDLVFFKGGDSIDGLPGHVGVYIGDGQMIDAPHTGADVRVESVWSFGGYMGARRYH